MSTPVRARGTFFPEAQTPRRSLHLAVRWLDQQAVAPDVTISTPVHAALRECICVGGAFVFDQVETVVKSHFPRLEAAVITAES